MTTFRGQRVSRPASGGKAGRGDQPYALGQQTGTYQGSVGNTHFFSAEETGGGSTDSLTATGKWSGGVVGKRYSVPSSNAGFISPVD